MICHFHPCYVFNGEIERTVNKYYISASPLVPYAHVDIGTYIFFQARLDILKIHSRKMNLTRGINLRKIAEMMPGASGAEVKV